MSKTIFQRLQDYYSQIATVLKGEANIASVFPNSTDVGITREQAYLKMLSAHLPSSCNVYKGGFLFDQNGRESKQLDVIITNSKALQFNFHYPEQDKTFACIDGCIGVVSIKSSLDTRELNDTLFNVASLPDKSPLNVSPLINIPNYNMWPYKIIYASDGMSAESVSQALQNFYQQNDIPINKRPDLIHVLGKYIFILVGEGDKTRDGTVLQPGTYHLQTTHPDTYAIPFVISRLQSIAESANHIITTYNWLPDKLPLF